jgi:hypothetical protein
MAERDGIDLLAVNHGAVAVDDHRLNAVKARRP